MKNGHFWIMFHALMDLSKVGLAQSQLAQRAMVGLIFFKALFLVQYGVFFIAFGPKHLFMHYPTVGDSCVYNLL
jgi:hypothetical protein